MPDPETVDQHVAQQSTDDAADYGAQQQQPPDGCDLCLDRVQIPAVFAGNAVDIQYPGTDPIRQIKNRRHSERISDPDQPHGDRQVAADQDCQYRSDQHLPGDGQKRPCNGLARQVPQVGIMQVTTKPPQVAMVTQRLLIRHVFFDQLSGHVMQPRPEFESGVIMPSELGQANTEIKDDRVYRRNFYRGAAALAAGGMAGLSDIAPGGGQAPARRNSVVSARCDSGRLLGRPAALASLAGHTRPS